MTHRELEDMNTGNTNNSHLGTGGHPGDRPAAAVFLIPHRVTRAPGAQGLSRLLFLIFTLCLALPGRRRSRTSALIFRMVDAIVEVLADLSTKAAPVAASCATNATSVVTSPGTALTSRVRKQPGSLRLNP